MDTTVDLSVNGENRRVTTDPERLLLDILREEFGLTGSKRGCGEGSCGACTVLIDGQRTRSCQIPIGDMQGKSITTIEGIARGGSLHPVQEAFLAEWATQCGFCTPGMILSAVALLERKPQPTDREINAWMNGNLCRCCGYPRIQAAIRRAASQAGKVQP